VSRIRTHNFNGDLHCWW